MPWIVRDGEVLASAEVASTRQTRRTGLLGREGIDGVLVLRPAVQIHTVGMRFPIDVVWCARDGKVIRIKRLGLRRVSRPVVRADFVVEAEAGTVGRWGLKIGDVLEVVDDAPQGG
jgi:uncharacterized membrane protein (UPF0127 family)